MEFESHPAWRVIRTVFFIAAIALVCFDGLAQSTVNVRIMAANLNGDTQSYQPFALRIFQGLKPDVVAIQEFNYTSTNGLGVNTPAAMREMIDTAFGTDFYYYREPFTGNGDIPNGIISRYPILTNASWSDTVQTSPNRGFAWAQIDLPGTNDLYIVSVHLLTSSASNRAQESINLKAMMQANFPANAWVVVAGDFNADPRTEACVTTYNGYLTDYPVPVDQNGNSDTSASRSTPHDYVLPSLTFTNFETATVMSSRSFPNGQVFDSRVYTPLTDVAPVQQTDSGLAQHMAVMKDFLIPVSGISTTNPPAITAQPQSQGVATGNSATFSATATGTAPLAYQWRFAGTNISGATTNPFVLASAQATNAGNYSVVITNIAGSITSSVAVLTVTNAAPFIATQPQGQSVLAGQSATFSVTASGTLPLNYQWRLGGTNISGATTNPFVLANVQGSDAGNYTVVITNIAGSITSSVAALNILFTNPVTFAQWNFNSSPADGSSSTGSTSPSIGSGTATAIGGVAASFVGGDTTLDPAGATDNTAWTTTTYPASTVGNKSAGVQFAVSTVGIQNIVISWSHRSSNTGGKYFRLQYATNGTTFVDFPTAAILTAPATFIAFTNSLATMPGVNNNASFAFRIVAEFESTATNGPSSGSYVAVNAPTSSYMTTGTTRFDMVTVSGTSFITSTPATNAMLSAPVFSAGQFQMLVAGTASSNYVVQVTTNLAPANWVGQFTNPSPFTFTDANLTAPQKFYRAIVQP
ncbi:MAG TPA: immunoglobulin domain-containing protein [Verrucomicrobiae bacterium]|nr:immunoglobulin domain-containing protein [Verrucomicrobiae bacterium]